MIIQKTWKNGTVDYMGHLRQEERSENTISQYYRDILCFLSWVKGQEITKNVVIRYKEKLQAEYTPYFQEIQVWEWNQQISTH